MALIQGQTPGGGAGGAGWIYITDVATQGAGTVTSKVWQDPPGNTILQSFTSSSPNLRFTIRASYPSVDLDGTGAVLDRDGSGGFYSGQVDITVGGPGSVVARVFDGDGVEGGSDTTVVSLDLPPSILTLSFTGSYPGSQTELKAGDSFQITGTTDKSIDRVEIQNYEALQYASIVASGTAFTITGTIADRGDVAVLRPGRVRVRDATTGAFSDTRDTNELGGSANGTDLVLCNDLRPAVGFGAVSYPPAQQGLKGSEQANVVNVISNADTVLFDSPTGELSILNPTAFGTPKVVTRISGSYNVSTNNLRATATRLANDAVSASSTIVNIANVPVGITVSPPASRLRSGGNDGTAIQNHTITITGDQQLLQAPVLDEDTGNSGTFIGSWTGGGTTWTRTLQVHDNDDKGTKNWRNPSAINLAGLTTTTIAAGSQYVLGGFVQRDLTFAAFVQSTTLNVAVIDYSKLSAGIFTATNQSAQRNPTQGDTSDITDTYTILASLGVNPQTLWWNDVAAASSNSSGTAQITDVEETA